MTRIQFHCPRCESFCFGSSQDDDGAVTRSCHGPRGDGGCSFSWPQEDDWKYFARVTVERFASPAEYNGDAPVPIRAHGVILDTSPESAMDELHAAAPAVGRGNADEVVTALNRAMTMMHRAGFPSAAIARFAGRWAAAHPGVPRGD